MLRWFTFLAFGILAAAACGCEQRTSRAITTPAFKLTILPAEVTVKQRSTTAVPGSEGELLLTVDDITRGQVMASLATASGDSVLPPRSMSAEDAVRFQFGKSSYSLTLKQLNNALIGEDVATFIVSSDAALTEGDKIEQLISAVAELQGAKFIRNGVEYSAVEAADHLRMKWRAAGAELSTAEQFIDAVASKSSTTGEPYRIRMPDGETIEAEAYLRTLLGEIE